MERIQLTKEKAIVVDFERGEIADILHGERRVNEGRVPMFSVKLRKRTGESRVVCASECSFVSFENNVALYASAFFDVEVHFRAENGGLRCRTRKILLRLLYSIYSAYR